ncbi:hypothetical protein NB600_18320 [Vibrio antiquarius]|uniref:hypothetical protein n=1 Tax=Vibrio diabolicus subgroup TaxID=2315253 RepID=UPI00211AD15D|nr:MULTISPECIES: hypothetical protein [Vibrio diabolicus subgroup]MCG6221607.1 hypothetical protein [Vibrio diabolicus]MCR9687755.1 hypothetical protein [Vibrio antiquarius]
METQEEKMKPREWLYIIFIIILLQFIVQAAAWLYGGNDGALGYISFAGTVVSIILAVLAIVYSYIQSLSQQNSATQISSQVDKLISITERMDMSKNDLTMSLDNLKKVSEKIDITIEHQTQIKEHVESLSNDFKEVDFDKLMGSEDTVSRYAASQKNSDDYFDKPFSGGYVGLSHMCIFLYYAEKKGVTLDQVVDELIIPTFDSFVEFSDDYERKKLVEFYRGSFTNAYQTLASFDFIYVIETGESRQFALNNGFSDACEQFIEFAINEESDDRSTDLLQTIISSCSEISEDAE